MAMPQPRLCILEAIGPRVASARMKRHDSRLPGHSSIRQVGRWVLPTGPRSSPRTRIASVAMT